MSDYRVTVARTLEDVEALREAWEALPVENPAVDIDYHLTFLRCAPAVVRPHVVLLELDGTPQALAVGRIQDVTLPVKLGYTTIYRPRVRTLTISRSGLLGADPERAPVLLETLLGALREETAEVLRLRSLPVGSPAHVLATTRPGPLVRERFTAPDERWQARIPATFDEYLQARSSKTRSSVKRYARRLEERFGDALGLRVFTRPDEAEELLRDSHAVHVKTYQHGLGGASLDSSVESELRALALEHGWFRGFVLYLEGVPSAFWHGNVYRGTFFTGPTGYDPAHRDLRLGTYLLSRMVERLCGEVDRLDFGVGEAEYKRHFGDERHLEEDVHVFARRPRPIAVNLARSGLLGTSRAGRAALERSGKVGEVRRWLRGRLAGKTPDGGERTSAAPLSRRAEGGR